MVCPRCDEQIKYGERECPNCGLRFKYTDEPVPQKRKASESRCSRTTASVLAYIFGAMGLHSFYLGYFIRGAIRLLLFLLFCGVFVSPQVANLIETGNFRIQYDAFGILGLVSLGIIIVSQLISIVEFINLILGNTSADAKGLPLRA